MESQNFFLSAILLYLFLFFSVSLYLWSVSCMSFFLFYVHLSIYFWHYFYILTVSISTFVLSVQMFISISVLSICYVSILPCFAFCPLLCLSLYLSFVYRSISDLSHCCVAVKETLKNGALTKAPSIRLPSGTLVLLELGSKFKLGFPYYIPTSLMSVTSVTSVREGQGEVLLSRPP
jgi:hypothetical protein